MTEKIIQEVKMGAPFYVLETLSKRFLFVGLDDAIAEFKTLLESADEKSGPEDLKVLRFVKGEKWDIVQLGTPEVFGRAYAPEKWLASHPNNEEGKKDGSGIS